MLCPGCGNRLRIPTDLRPIASTFPLGADPTAPDTKKTRWEPRKILLGAFLLTVGIAIAIDSYFSWTQGGRVRVMLPVTGLLSIVFGVGMLLKGLFGDAIEWD